MEQRRLRLGDILDDYCPRERRVTNHAVVAMIEEDVKQTRCTTCDAEHAYKGARVPKRRKKETPPALYKEVLAGMPETEAAAAGAAVVPTVTTPLATPDVAAPVVASQESPVPVNTSAARSHPPMQSDDTDQRDQFPEEDPRLRNEAQPRPDDETPTADGPVHRPLIRATLPRPDGQKDARPVPEFTVRHAPSRGGGSGNFRGGDRMRMRAGNGNGHGTSNANRGQNSGSRFHGNKSGRQPMGRAGAPSGYRGGNSGSNGKRGRGSRG